MTNSSTIYRMCTSGLLVAFGLTIGVNTSSGQSPDTPEKGPAKRLGYGPQAWNLSVEFPAEFVKQKGAEKYRITSLAYGSGLWAVVMSQDSGYDSQFWETSSTTFPQSVVRQHWAEGRNITSVAYGEGMWVVVLSKGTGIYSQYWQVSTKFPEAFVKQHWDEGRQITSMTYGGGAWCVVMSKSTHYTSQFWKTSRDFPEPFVQQHWNDSRDLTSVAYGGGLWGAVMSRLTREDPTPRGFLGVSVVDAPEGVKGALVQDAVAGSPAAKAGIQKNDVIIAVADSPTANSTEMLEKVKASPIGAVSIRLIRGSEEKTIRAELDGRTGVVEKSFAEQQWKSNAEFPREFIDEHWEEGFFITSVTHGGGVWMVVMSKNDQMAELPKRTKVPEPTIKLNLDALKQ